MAGHRYSVVCKSLGVAGIALLVLSPLLTRFQLAPLAASLLLVPLAALAGFAAVITGAWGLRKGRATENGRNLMVGLLLGLVPMGFLGALIGAGRGLPRIHDITTDLADPPVFVTAPGLPREALNSLDYDPRVAELQRQAFPDLRPIVTAEPPAAAFQRALRAARGLGWEIYAEDAAAGRIEAVETTLLYGFKDDVVIRIRPHAAGSVVDLRSVSRVGEGDLGANAKRIRRFAAAYQGRE